MMKNKTGTSASVLIYKMASLRKLVITLITCCLYFTCHSSQAQNEIVQAIRVIDIQHILDNSLALKDLRSQTEKIAQDLQKKVTKKQQELKIEEEELIQKKGKTSIESSKKDFLFFENKMQEAKKYAKQQKSSLDKAYSNAIVQVNSAISKVIEDLCNEKKC